MRANKPVIVVLGSLHLDILVKAPDRPRKGETLRGSGWALSPGGKGGNQAACAARQGPEVYMIGRVGRDDFGARLIGALQAAGVRTDYVLTDDSGDSGMSVAIIDEEGDYGAIIVSGVNLHIGQEDIRRAGDVITGADCLLLQYEIPLDTVRAAAQFAHQCGVRVILNAAPAYPAPEHLLEHVDVLIVNEVEAEMLTGHSLESLSQAEQALRTLNQLVPTVLLTLGAKGVYIADPEVGITHLPAYTVPVVDTHGAGDAFIGAFAARSAWGDKLLEAVRYANAAGALMVMQPGPQSDEVTPDRIRAFLSGTVADGGYVRS